MIVKITFIINHLIFFINLVMNSYSSCISTFSKNQRFNCLLLDFFFLLFCFRFLNLKLFYIEILGVICFSILSLILITKNVMFHLF